MNVLPRTDRELMTWVRTRLETWQVEAAAIGLSQADVDELAGKLDAAAEAYSAVVSARTHARTMTVGWRFAGGALRELAGALVASIKAKAERTGNRSVYTDALIPPARRRSALGRPPMPLMRGLSMPHSGIMELRWTGTRRGGTMFLIYRGLHSGSASTLQNPTLLDSTTQFVYRDRTLPPGTLSVSYYIVAQRAGGRSEPSGTSSFTFSHEPVAVGEASRHRAA